jgi:hypothetical protein
MKRLWAVGMLAGLLAACSPTYNWREIEIAGGAARAAFPARVQTDRRPVALAGQALDFSLTSASIEDAVFAVGYAPLPPALAADEAKQRDLGTALMRSLYENLRAQPPAAFPAYGENIEVHGQAGGKPVWLLARVWVQGGMLVEAVATGSEQGLPPDPAHEFVKSLRFLR